MIKIKKTLLGTLLSCLMAVCLCFGIVNIKNDTKSAAAETLTTTSVTKVQVRDNKLFMFLSEQNFGSATASENAKNHIADALLNNIEIYAGETHTTLKNAITGDAWYNHYGESGCIAILLDGVTYTNASVSKIIVKAGCEFPSAASGTSAYVTEEVAMFNSGGLNADNQSVNWTKIVLKSTSVTNIHHRNDTINRLLLFLEPSDYASVDATTSAGNDIEATGVNMLDKILLYTDDNTYVTLREAWKGNGQTPYESYYNVWTAMNSICLDTKSDYGLGKIKYVTILDGCTFPSASTHVAGYVQSGDVTFYNNGYGTSSDCTDWTQLHSTSVTKVQVRDNKLFLFLSEQNFGSATASENAKNHIADALLNNIEIYAGETHTTLKNAITGDAWYNHYGESGCIAILLDGVTYTNASVSKIIVKAGCGFPSAANGRRTYITEEEATFYSGGLNADNQSVNWTKIVLKSTSVTNIHHRNDTINRLLLFLEPSDYASVDATTSAKKDIEATGVNMLDKILVYTDDNTYVTLREAWKGNGQDSYESYYNVWTAMNSICLDTKSDYGLGKIKYVTILDGCTFPSASTHVAGYVQSGDVTFYNNGYGTSIDCTDWTKTETPKVPVEPAELTATSVTKVQVRDNKLFIFLSEQNFGSATASENAKNHIADALLNNIEIYAGETHTTLKEARGEKTSAWYNHYGDTGCIAILLDGVTYTNASVTKIVFKAGCEFPSAVSGESAYVINDEVAFVSGGLDESEQSTLWKHAIATEIARVDFNDTGSDNILHVYLTTSDYGTTEGSVDFKSKVAALNMQEYIEIDGVKLSAMNLGAQLINFWTRWGAFGLQLKDYNTPKVPSYIHVKAGCQIPSLSYAKDESLDIYVIEEDTWIVYNSYYRVWDITTQAPEMTVAIGDILPAYESTEHCIFLGWEINDALYQGGKAATVAGVAKAIWVDYALKEGASIRMGNTADESGIRFAALLQEESYNTYGKYINSVGVLVLPLELLGAEEFTAEHSAQPVNFYALKEKGFHFADGILTVRGTLHTVRATNYNRDYAARAYVDVTYADGTTGKAYGYFQEENHVRNIYEVASAAHKKGEGTAEQRLVLVGYANKIADLTLSGDTFTATEGTIGSAISAIQTQSIADGVVTLSIRTKQNEEPLLIVGGKPIRSAQILEKSFADNLFTVSFLYETESNLTYYASNDKMQQFFQDYFELYTMSGAYAVTHNRVSNGPTYQQDWFMNAMSWFKATDLVVNEETATQNGTYNADGYALYYLNNIDIDKNGNVYSEMNDRSYSTSDGGPAYSTVTSYYVMNSQGWALPNMESAGWEAYHAEFNGGTLNGTLAAEKSSQSGYANKKESSDGWKVNGSTVTQVDGVAEYVGTAKTGLTNATGATNAIVYEVTGISYYAFNAPFVEVRLLLKDPNAVITDYAIEWQTGGTWYSVTQSEYANNPFEMPNATGMYRSYFPLYTHANYGAGKSVTSNESKSGYKTITGLRVVLIAKNTTSFVTVGLDYVRATADSRHSVNGPKYIIALNEYASYHNDIELLVNNITRARRAMLFQLKPLQGEAGLVNLSYLHRHDSYQGAPNSYWDIYPAGNLNTEANVYFYEGLLALAEMEEALVKQGITVTETASIEWHDLTGTKQTATYTTDTAASLRELAKTVKGKIQTTFYSTTTGRFAWSVRDVDAIGNTQANKKGKEAAGSLMDYGFTELNLHAVAAGVATTEQATSIMGWINGTRTVTGDKVSGSGIYEQPFAPVTTTVDNQKYWSDGSNITSVIESDFAEYYYDKKYGVQCQDGGTIMHVSYYDILARAKALGVDNAYSRISAIASWFAGVKTQNLNAASEGWANFFKNYYTTSGALQGADGAGKYGLQDEFKEAVMVMATAPKIFLGLDAHYDTLTIAPNLGSTLTHFGMENLAFGEKTYTCYVTKTSISLSGITGNVNSGLKVKLKLAYTDGQSVYLNGKLLDSGKYTVEGSYVIVTTDFANLTLQVK